jgi:hypothetical protein
MWNFVPRLLTKWLEIESSWLDVPYSLFFAKYKVDQINNDELR